LYFLELADRKSFPFTGKKNPFFFRRQNAGLDLRSGFSFPKCVRKLLSCPPLSGKSGEVSIAIDASSKHSE